MGLVLCASCSRQTSLVPISNNTYYADDRLIAEASSPTVGLSVNFDRSTKDFYIYEVQIENRSSQSLALSPADFFYQTQASNVKFQGISYEKIVEHIDQRIVHKKKIKEVDGWLDVLDVVTDVVLNTGDEDGSEDYYESQEDLSNQIIYLYELKEYLSDYYLKSIELSENESYYGIVYFPRMRKDKSKAYNIVYGGVDRQIEIPFARNTKRL